MHIKINLLGYQLALHGSARRLRRDYVAGYTNRCKNGSFIVFLDYDNVEFKWIAAELEHLQERFMLGDFYIFASSDDSFHAVCFDKVNLSVYLDILKNSSVDPNYITVPLHFGKKIWTLRLTDKDDIPIRFVGALKSKAFSFRQESTAHADVLNSLFDLGIKLNNPDGVKELVLARYPI